MPMHIVTLKLAIRARTARAAQDIGAAALQHLADTFNDDESLGSSSVVRDCRVIARMVPRRDRVGLMADNVILFFPDDEADPGSINCYARVGQHSEASLDYYRETRVPRMHIEREACDRAITAYRAHIASIPELDRVNLIVSTRR